MRGLHLTVVQGQICCRFENDSDYLPGLGDFFAKRQTSNFQSYFEIESDLGHLHTLQVSHPSDGTGPQAKLSRSLYHCRSSLRCGN